MKYTLALLITIYSIVTSLYGQPGGGGGLQIVKFFDEDLKPMNLFDSALSIRAFVLRDSSESAKAVEETYPILSYEKISGQFKNKGYYLPPLYGYHRSSNQRLVIFYGIKVMVIDFLAIWTENGGGYIDDMDSLVFQPGYFRYYRSREGEAWNDENRTLRQFGLTPYTISTKKIVPAASPIGPAILEAIQPSSRYFFTRGINSMVVEQYGQAISNIVESLNLGLEDKYKEQALTLLSEAYYKTNQYPEALATMVKGIQDRSCICEIFYPPAFHYIAANKIQDALVNFPLTGVPADKFSVNNPQILLELYAKNSGKKIEAHYSEAILVYSEAIQVCPCDEYYRARAYLFIKSGKPESALEDFNSIADRRGISLDKVLERSMFKIHYLKDFTGAAKDLEGFLSDNPFQFQHYGEYGSMDSYSAIYFLIGISRYNLKEYDLATTAWRQSIELRRDVLSTTHFDFMIRKHPKIAALYLGRAIAYFKLGQCCASGRKSYNMALQDLERAEVLGFNDYRVNLYRAHVFTQIGWPSKALKEVNRAIIKNRDDLRCYQLRLDVKRNMGIDVKEDSDWDKIEELKGEWRFN